MLYKNNIFTIIALSTLCIAAYVYRRQQYTPQPNVLTIGILQTASHPALDAARQGFIDTFSHHAEEPVKYIIRNAEGSPIAAHTIAEKFHHTDTVKAIYTIGTPALQAMYALEKEKPIFIAAVSNPETILTNTHKNVCGTTDMIDIPGAIQSIVDILPHITSIALIYNPAEANSIAQINSMKQELTRHAITTLLVGVSSEAEIAPAASSALRKADALLAPTDNLIASTIPLISHLAEQIHKPFIASHNQAVEEGALMARGVDYYASGAETAHIALQVLMQNAQPSDIPIRATKSDIIMINKKVMNTLNINIPATDTIQYILQ